MMNLTLDPQQSGNTAPPSYVGRFAPSPSGELHMGSLICAVASYLDAKAHNGKWLVRIEDIDPPREQAGATDAILASLLAHRLIWDDDVLRQSTRNHAYNARLRSLHALGLTYRCNCTRKRLKTLARQYDQHCLRLPAPVSEPAAVRINSRKAIANFSCGKTFTESIQALSTPLHANANQLDDFVVHRKDNLFAYQLAVVTDDITQGVTHIVRGYDLFDTTHQYVFLHTLFNRTSNHLGLSQSALPIFSHIPILLDSNGNKLSKQNHAQALSNQHALANILIALEFLGIKPSKQQVSAFNKQQQIDQLIQWAVARWPQAKNKLRGIQSK